MVIYLFSLTPDLSSQIKGKILGANSVLDLQSTFARVLRISIATPSSVPNQSAMAATRGRGRGGLHGGGCGCTNS